MTDTRKDSGKVTLKENTENLRKDLEKMTLKEITEDRAYSIKLLSLFSDTEITIFLNSSKPTAHNFGLFLNYLKACQIQNPTKKQSAEITKIVQAFNQSSLVINDPLTFENILKKIVDEAKNSLGSIWAKKSQVLTLIYVNEDLWKLTGKSREDYKKYVYIPENKNCNAYESCDDYKELSLKEIIENQTALKKISSLFTDNEIQIFLESSKPMARDFGLFLGYLKAFESERKKDVVEKKEGDIFLESDLGKKLSDLKFKTILEMIVLEAKASLQDSYVASKSKVLSLIYNNPTLWKLGGEPRNNYRGYVTDTEPGLAQTFWRNMVYDKEETIENKQNKDKETLENKQTEKRSSEINQDDSTKTKRKSNSSLS